MPGQKDTVLNKSDVAKFGNPEQRNIPLINFAARKTVRNHHKKFENLMRSHGKAQMNKIMGIRTIRKRDTQPRDPHARSNLGKVSRTKVPPKRQYNHSPKRANRVRNDLVNRLKAPMKTPPTSTTRKRIALMTLQRILKLIRRTCRPAVLRGYEP